MTIIQEIVVDPSAEKAHFACNLQKCRGACCTMPGGLGAPLLEQEIGEIEKAFPVIQKYLPDDHLRVIAERGLVEKHAGGFTTPCINKRACVFVTYDGDIAKCAFEKAYRNGEIGWIKPLSCHLFPLRVEHGSMVRVRYEPLPECSPGRENGERLQTPLFEFLKEPIIRAFGSRWYDELTSNCGSFHTTDEVNTV